MSDKIKYPLLGLIIGSCLWASVKVNKYVAQEWTKELVKSECLK